MLAAWRRATAIVASTLLLAGCSGDRGMPLGSTGAAPAARGSEPHVDKVVEGVVKTDTWTVPTNQTWIIGPKGLTVFAKTIYVDGNLLVASGRRLVLLAPKLDVNGRIGTAQSGLVRTDTPSVSDVIGTCEFRVAIATRATGISMAFPPGDRVYVGATAPGCYFSIYGYFVTTSGRSGNFALKGLHDGEPGGSIDIGTVAAAGEISEAARQIGESVKTRTVRHLGVDGTIQAGWGGDGAYDTAGEGSKDSWSFAPGAGAAGGDVGIDAGEFNQTGTTSFVVTAGRGGDGGGIGVANLDGTAASPNGGHLHIEQAAGGRGGSVHVFAVPGEQPLTTGGSGGNAGMVSAAAGGGYSLKGGKGGSIGLNLAAPGAGGENASHVAAPDGAYPLMAFTGGNGGSGALGAIGGTGGSFILTRPDAVKPLPPSTMSFDGFAGGAGGSKCGSQGVAGGAGGNFNESATTSDFNSIFENGATGSAFSGGTGGTGGIDTPGPGGTAGQYFFNGKYVQAVGTAGSTGRGC